MNLLCKLGIHKYEDKLSFGKDIKEDDIELYKYVDGDINVKGTIPAVLYDVCKRCGRKRNIVKCSLSLK